MSPCMKLLLGEHTSLRLPTEDALAQHVEHVLAHGDGPHGMVHPTSPEAGLGNREGLTFAAQETVRRDSDVVVVNESVHALVF